MEIQFSGKEVALIVNNFKKDWNNVFSETEINSFGMRSADPPSILQIVGELLDWTLPLKVATTAFLAQLGKEAASDIWKNKGKIFSALKQENCSKLYKTTKIIHDSISKTENDCKFILTLSYPKNFIEAELLIQTQNEAEIAFKLAIFIENLENIQNSITKELQGKYPPSQLVFLNIDDNGYITMSWMDTVELKKHEKIINEENYANKTRS